MHELGIVFYIIKDVKEAAAQNAVDHIDAVVMDIGEVSTIVPEYLQDMWRWAADREDLLKGRQLAAKRAYRLLVHFTYYRNYYRLCERRDKTCHILRC